MKILVSLKGVSIYVKILINLNYKAFNIKEMDKD